MDSMEIMMKGLSVRNNTLSDNAQGFTLIELMIVVAIIGVLASVALPAYQGYVVKANTSTAVSNVNNLKTKIIEKYSFEGTLVCPAGLNTTSSPVTCSEPTGDGASATPLTLVSGDGKVKATLSVTSSADGNIDWDCKITGTASGLEDTGGCVISTTG